MYLLIDIIDFDRDPFTSFIICAGIFVIGIAIYYYFARWVFSINKRIENQEKQIQLLEKIAGKLGVEEKPPHENAATE